MKIAVIGAAGVRTPLIIQAMLNHQNGLGLRELALMDVDAERLDLIGSLTAPIEKSSKAKFLIIRTTDPLIAMKDADFVITTFRVGGIESRMIDERVPLNHGVLGQETTGAGGFAMGLRTIPVLIDYVQMMQKVCPHAWLINFANPAGMLTEAVIRYADWHRVVGICDGPSSMHGVIAGLLGAELDEVYLDYFGLNHLGWIKRVLVNNRDRLFEILEWLKPLSTVPGLPYDSDFVTSLGMIPNEYLFYYYYNVQAVNNILRAGECRGEQVARENLKLFSDLKSRALVQDFDGMQASYQAYLDMRGNSYMVKETGQSHDFSTLDSKSLESTLDEGYAGVALNLIESLVGNKEKFHILNVANHGSIKGMESQDVVEIPTVVSHDQITPMDVSDVPMHCLGLIQQVKHYEHLTIEAAVENSYSNALLALTLHPLVRDFSIAKAILDDYISLHHGYFPVLQ